MEAVIESLQVFTGLEANVARPSELSVTQVDLLPTNWLLATRKYGASELQILSIFAEQSGTKEFAAILAKHVREILFIFDSQTPKCLGLAYVFNVADSSIESNFLFAKTPASSASIGGAETRFGKKLPHSLRGFLLVHDGIAVSGNFGMSFKSVSMLKRLGELVDVNESAADLVSFASDGLGNYFCVSIDSDSSSVVEWDHEDSSIRMLGTFEAAIANILRDFMYLPNPPTT